MPQIKDVNIGEKFNRWTILKDLGTRQFNNGYTYHYVLARCDCGTERELIYSTIYTNNSKSCGCYNEEASKERMTIHGLSGTRIYRIWKDMRRRCNNPNRRNYKDYGGRGIKVCDEWDKDFMNFYNWSYENGYKENLSIDRIDCNGNYEPNNCRWATRIRQNRNTRKNKKFKATSPYGDIYIRESQAQFADDHGLDRAYINSCLIGKQNTYKGWTFEYI